VPRSTIHNTILLVLSEGAGQPPFAARPCCLAAAAYVGDPTQRIVFCGYVFLIYVGTYVPSTNADANGAQAHLFRWLRVPTQKNFTVEFTCHTKTRK